jgi:hypothetical protein
MSEQKSKPILNFYVDDSGTRHPDHKEPTSSHGDWFGLGGVLINQEDVDKARELHKAFCSRWELQTPLHSVKIRHRSDSFAWLEGASSERRESFYSELNALLLSLPILGMACVIDRPGYRNRYLEKYGRQRWQLCKTAFSVICERVAKHAVQCDRRVRIYVEESDKSSDAKIREYFRDLRENGMPFSDKTSAKYGPLDAGELKYRLLDLKFKRKTSPMMQVADLFLYPICRSAYDPDYRPILEMQRKSKLIDNLFDDPEARRLLGIKFSCFD